MNTYNEIRNLNYKVRNLNQAFKCLRDYVKNDPGGGEVYTEANLLLNSDYGSGYVYQRDFNQGVVDALDEAVKTVNGVEPDDSGDVTLDIPEVTAQTLFNDVTNIIDSADIRISRSNVFFPSGDMEPDWGKTFYIVKGVPITAVMNASADAWYYPTYLGPGSFGKVNKDNIALVGNNTVAIGNRALGDFNPTTTSTNNTAIGGLSMNSLINGATNTAIGTESLNDITEGSRNTVIGYKVLDGATKASGNTIIGTLLTAGSLGTGTEVNNQIAISYGEGQIGFRVDGNTGLTTVPKQTLTSYNDDTTGKAVVTKEVLDNEIANIDIPEVDLSNVLKKNEANTVTENFEITNGSSKFKLSDYFAIQAEVDGVSTINLGSDDGYAVSYYNDNGRYFEAYAGGISGGGNGYDWSLGTRGQGTSGITLPITGENDRTLPVSVNGNYADDNGNIEINEIPTPPETGCYTLQSNDGIVSWIPCTE